MFARKGEARPSASDSAVVSMQVPTPSMERFGGFRPDGSDAGTSPRSRPSLASLVHRSAIEPLRLVTRTPGSPVTEFDGPRGATDSTTVDLRLLTRPIQLQVRSKAPLPPRRKLTFRLAQKHFEALEALRSERQTTYQALIETAVLDLLRREGADI